MYDVAIIGRGPAGISAAINATIRNKSVVMFGDNSKKIISSPEINNYPGLPEIKGSLLSEKMSDHLESTGAFLVPKQITAIYSMGNSFTMQAEDEMIEAKTVILSVGVDFKKSIEGEDTFLGMGVSYCATCDGPLYKGKPICVIGYNEESISETKYLSEICSKVYFIPMHASKDNFDFSENVELVDSSPVKFDGKSHAERLILKDLTIEADGFFVIKDSYPLGALVPGLVVDGPHVLVDKHMNTNIKGLYAAGDVTGKPYQVAKAIGEGQIAAFTAIELLNADK